MAVVSHSQTKGVRYYEFGFDNRVTLIVILEILK